jgi:hypothetical protein
MDALVVPQEQAALSGLRFEQRYRLANSTSHYKVDTHIMDALVVPQEQAALSDLRRAYSSRRGSTLSIYIKSYNSNSMPANT